DTLSVTAWTQDGADMSAPETQDVDMQMVYRPVAQGTDEDDILVGNHSHNALDGGDGDDILFGGAGNDTLVGGAGNDLLIGGAGNDTFKWNAGDQGDAGNPAVDTILDFGLAGIDGMDTDDNGNDELDLSDLLQGEHYELDAEGNVFNSNLEEYLHFEQAGDDTVISVSSQGGSDGQFDESKVDQKITLKDVAITDLVGADASQSDILNALIISGKLTVDQG